MSKKRRTTSLLAFLILLAFSFSVFAGDLLPLQGNVDLSGTPVSSGGLVVEIWDGPDVAGSNLIYNSTDNYTGSGNISSGKFDIVLGSVGDELNLEYGKVYYMDLFIAGNNMNFSSQERQIFMSSVGIINSSFLNTSNDYELNSLLIDNKTAITNAYLNISDGTSPKLVVMPDGSIGIGTSSPAFRLDVYGDINSTSILINATTCTNGLVTDANGLLYCSPTPHTFDDISVNASIANLDLQLFYNATERTADNSTLTNMIGAINADAYDSSNLAFLNETVLNNTYQKIGDDVPFDDTSVNVTQQNDNTTLWNAINGLNLDAYNPGNVAFLNESVLNDTYQKVGEDVAFDDVSVNVTHNIDNQTLSNMVNSINPDAYDPANIAFYNETVLNNTYLKLVDYIDSSSVLNCTGAQVLLGNGSCHNIDGIDTDTFGNDEAYNPDNIAFLNESVLNATYQREAFNDISVNATQSQDNSSVWNNISSIAGLVNQNKDDEFNDNVTVWLNLSDISTRLGTYFAFTGLLSELVNDVGYLIYGSYQFAELNETTLNNTYARMDEVNSTYARLNDFNTFTGLNHFSANVSMADNLTVGGNALYVDSSSGNVGIGTTAPTHALSVDGSANITGNVTATIYKKSCPDGFIPVPHDNIYTFEDFCVMKYEAKCVESATGACGNSGTYLPVSQAGNSPWVSIYQNNSAERCKALGERYHLITNNEWMTIALNVFNQPENWVSGSVGSGCMYGGHMECDGAPCNNAWNASTNDNEGYWNETANYSSTTSNCPFSADEGRGVETRRTFTLSNGEVIWDLSGNVWEWTADVISVYDRPYVAGSDYGWQEYTDLNVTKSLGINELDWYYDDNFLNSNQGAGKVYTTQGSTGAQQCYSSITGAYDMPICAFLRGGYWNFGASAGVFALGVFGAPSYSYTSVGFRCCQ